MSEWPGEQIDAQDQPQLPVGMPGETIPHRRLTGGFGNDNFGQGLSGLLDLEAMGKEIQRLSEELEETKVVLESTEYKLAQAQNRLHQIAVIMRGHS